MAQRPLHRPTLQRRPTPLPSPRLLQQRTKPPRQRSLRLPERMAPRPPFQRHHPAPDHCPQQNMEQRQVLRIQQNQNVCRIEQNVLTSRTNLWIKQKCLSCILIYKTDSNFYRYRINRFFKV